MDEGGKDRPTVCQRLLRMKTSEEQLFARIRFGHRILVVRILFLWSLVLFQWARSSLDARLLVWRPRIFHLEIFARRTRNISCWSPAFLEEVFSSRRQATSRFPCLVKGVCFNNEINLPQWVGSGESDRPVLINGMSKPCQIMSLAVLIAVKRLGPFGSFTGW